jgi:hypothetical protein
MRSINRLTPLLSTFVLVPLTVAGVLVACSSSTTSSGGTPAVDAAAEAAEQAEDASTDGTTADLDSASPQDAAPDTNVDVPLNDAGCLTFAGASKICGFMSDDKVCAFSVGCGTSTDDGQCKINCEMGTTVKCYSAADVKCLEDAVAAKSCAALTACNWVL